MSQTQPPALPPPVPVQPVEGVIPYATPALYQQQAVAAQMAGAWSDGNLLVCTKWIALPNHCCVLCDQPADGEPLKKQFSWHSPWVFFTILGGVLIYAILALVISEKAKLVVPLCRRHRSRRSTMILLTWLLVLGGIASLIGAAVVNEAWPAVVGAVALVAGIVTGIVGAQTIRPKRIDGQYAWFKGASAAYLAGLPSVHPPQ